MAIFGYLTKATIAAGKKTKSLYNFMCRATGLWSFPTIFNVYRQCIKTCYKPRAYVAPGRKMFGNRLYAICVAK